MNVELEQTHINADLEQMHINVELVQMHINGNYKSIEADFGRQLICIDMRERLCDKRLCDKGTFAPLLFHYYSTIIVLP